MHLGLKKEKRNKEEEENWIIESCFALRENSSKKRAMGNTCNVGWEELINERIPYLASTRFSPKNSLIILKFIGLVHKKKTSMFMGAPCIDSCKVVHLNAFLINAPGVARRTEAVGEGRPDVQSIECVECRRQGGWVVKCRRRVGLVAKLVKHILLRRRVEWVGCRWIIGPERLIKGLERLVEGLERLIKRLELLVEGLERLENGCRVPPERVPLRMYAHTLKEHYLSLCICNLH